MDINNQSFNFLKTETKNLDVHSLIDLSLLSTKKLAIEVSEDEFTKLYASYGFILESQEILLLTTKHKGVADLPGFYSINNKLIDKTSMAINNKLKKIKLIIYIKNEELFQYNKTKKSVYIDSTTQYSQIVSTLTEMNYEKVDYVEQEHQYCIKGGIIDFYSPIYKNPIRAYLYDNDTKYLYYNLGTGMPAQGGTNKVYLSLNENKTVSYETQKLIKDNSYYTIKRSLSAKNKTVETLTLDKVKKEKEIQYLPNIYFNGYKIGGKVYAPVHFKNLKNEVEKKGFVQGFERGDVVCHEDYGIGQFGGFVDYSGDEYVKIKYTDGSINLSVKQLFKLSFVSRETGSGTKINSLSRKGVWLRKSKTILKNASKYVDNLVDMYSKREKLSRPPFVHGGKLEEEFINSFQYSPTSDQMVVWNELSNDLGLEVPMSRLLCGDVGFGKTELAIRASFRVVINGGKALVLCPTSILVNQHVSVFCERVESFGVSVSSLTGGLSTKERESIKTSWIENKIDILVATSAALYDVVFVRDASLVVVDEEHRFGVKDKEELVNSFVNKDVLYMSATPIPRTLHLSLSGVHSISTLASPPFLRKPIVTVVSYFSKETIKQAVAFELNRQGQVFYVHNRIDTINSVKTLIESLSPFASVRVVHSKLGSKIIKKSLLDFANKKYNVLLCTSIVGSGIDIPNANTIIINKANLFGLSQLHQIRGRVGRSGQQGYAYLMVSKNVKLNSGAKRRLRSIEKNTSLGSGYNIARSDLEIRGAGTMFGYKQSGSSFDVGYEYYSKIVSSCVETRLQKNLISMVDGFLYRVSFVCRFEEGFVVSSYERLRLYRELSSLYDLKGIDRFRSKVESVYGAVSFGGANIINMRKFSILCCYQKIINISFKGDQLTLFFNNCFNDMDSLIKFLNSNIDKFSILSFVFGVANGSTNIKINFKQGLNIDGMFLFMFMGDYNEFCKV